MVEMWDQFIGLPPPSLEWKCFLFLTLKNKKDMNKENLITSFAGLEPFLSEKQVANLETFDVNDVPTGETFQIIGLQNKGKKGDEFFHQQIVMQDSKGVTRTSSLSSIIGSVTDLDENEKFIAVEGKSKDNKGKFYPKSGKRFNPTINRKTVFNWLNKDLKAEPIEYIGCKVFEVDNPDKIVNAEKVAKTGYKLTVV